MVRRTIVAGALALAVLAGLSWPAVAVSAQNAATGKPSVQQIDLNTATAADLEKLHGIGAAMAARILEYREKNGGFKKIEELMNVQGIGEKRFLELKGLITVTPPKTAQ